MSVVYSRGSSAQLLMDIYTVLSRASAHERLSFVPEFAEDGRLHGWVGAYDDTLIRAVGVVNRVHICKVSAHVDDTVYE